ncbi:MAG: chorismate synthase [Bacteroidetes bacterium]|nr:chorismate synthase [Bacteroidota bacterium]
MNALGNLFKVTSFGESHGALVGCVLEGCPAGLLLDIALIQKAVDKRKTGQHFYASARKETDTVRIVSGVFESKTLGTPIGILIQNENAQSADYDHLKNVYRPGHADAAYDMKYGYRDHRGGGRSSIRVTAPMVAAGEIARQLLCHYFPLETITYVTQIGNVTLGEPFEASQSAIQQSAVSCPDKATTEAMLQLIADTAEAGDTLGGAIRCIIKNLPAGIGEPIFGKLQAQLAHAMLNINTVKAFEYGTGTLSAGMKGSAHNDAFISDGNTISMESNRHGGILGGISTGMDIGFKVTLKPISSIQQTQRTINKQLQTASIQIGGRHDVCAVPRAIPIVEAYTYMVLADLWLHHKHSII